jgi:hypothetical protein
MSELQITTIKSWHDRAHNIIKDKNIDIIELQCIFNYIYIP